VEVVFRLGGNKIYQKGGFLVVLPVWSYVNINKI